MSTKIREPIQKLVYSKDSSMNLGASGSADASIMGLFKSSSSLARSIRQQPSTNASSSLKSSGALIINSTAMNVNEKSLSMSKASFKPSVSSTSKDIKIRNITHDYTNIDVNEDTYKILSSLRSQKRMRNLDILDEYEVWKTNYDDETETNVKNKVNELQNQLDSTQNEIYSKFTMKDDELIPLSQNDIDGIAQFYHSVIQSRDNNIEDTLKYSMDKFSECYSTVMLKIVTLSRELDLTGFLLEEEIKKLTDDKTAYITNWTNCKKNLYNKLIKEIRDREKEIVENSQKDLVEFILRWKNVKLNNYLKELKEFLQSKEIIDNEERYTLIENIKKDQIDIYEKRKQLIFEKVFKLPYEEINTKSTEKVNKELDEIYSYAEKTFIHHIEILVKNSEDIEKKSLEEIERFKQNVDTVSYDFTKDNHNEKKYNDYDDIDSITALIDKEVNPIIAKNKEDRTNYISKINTYIDEYDEYTHNISTKIINIYLSLGKLHDEHRRNLSHEEKKYLISIAKATDNDEDIILAKETELQKILIEMRNCINKEELDGGLAGCFKIMDELEVEYRDYFKIIDDLLNSHEGIIGGAFQTYEEKVLKLFGKLAPALKEEIENRRNIESNFLSKKKEAEIAYEEAKAAEEEAKNNEKAGKKAKPAPKKQDKKPALKKGEVPPPLVPPREITEYKSKLEHDYLVDYTVEELIKHFLRNIIYNRDDDIFELKPKTKEELERIQKEKEEKEKEEKEKQDAAAGKKKKPDSRSSKKSDKKDPNKSSASLPSSPTETNIDFYSAFDPYNADPVKTFVSPQSMTNLKLLSEDNYFTVDNIVNAFNGLFEMLTDKLAASQKSKVDESKLNDNETREEHLSELDMRLKLLSPKKGKIEVEEYDKRLAELEKHDAKLKAHKEDIMKKNEQDTNDNNALLEKVDKNFSELSTNYETLSKQIEEEENGKGLEDKFKQFKTMYYDFISQLNEDEVKLNDYAVKAPQGLMQLNKNYILSLLPISKGGTYSDREIEFTKGELNAIDENELKKAIEERTQMNKEKIDKIKADAEAFLKDVEEKYAISAENISAKDGVGKKFGAPKRLVNDIIINIKIKCNQAMEGLDNLFKQLQGELSTFNSLKDITKLNEALKKDDLPIKVRKLLSRINTCVFYYGKYIDAFKPTLLSSYALTRVIMKENIESSEIVNKEDIDADEVLKNEELTSLGFLAKSYADPSQAASNAKGAQKGATGEPLFNSEISSIDERVKAECAKIYVGNFAKYLNPQEKIPDSLIPFILSVKSEMELMRLKCVRELRTFCQSLYKYSIEIPQVVVKYIFMNSSLKNKESNEAAISAFEAVKSNSAKTKEKLSSILGPYLANPYFEDKLKEISSEDDTRSQSMIESINKTQFAIIENDEQSSKEFTTRLLNNFECLMMLFDNFIFEEEFISLGDEEYFKQRQKYNELLKLKAGIEEMSKSGQTGNKNVKAQNLDASNFNLDSKRTFKKVYKGINYTEGKNNYYKLFTETVKNCVENSEEKIKVLESEYSKENYSKSITGIKLQNNKNLFIFRNEYYKTHCEEFNVSITNAIAKFNKERFEELEYKHKWDEMINKLKEAIAVKDKDILNEEKKDNVVLNK